MITTKISDQEEIADIVELEEIEAQKLIILIIHSKVIQIRTIQSQTF
jgi:hypothetical protein